MVIDRISNPNLLDKIIRYISPVWAYNRLKSSAQIEFMQRMTEHERKYAAASYGPLTEDWFSTWTSARAEVSMDAVTLRNRMRELVRNDGWASTATQKLATNVVGSGIRPSFMSKNEALKKKLDNEFLAWCDSLDCDFVNNTNFYGLEELVVKGMAESGDCLIVKRYKGRGSKAKLSLQLLENDFIVTWLTMIGPDGFPEGTYILNGVYYDKFDKVIGYEIFLEHPGDYLKSRDYKHEFVKAEDVILLFRADRPNQSRGVPWGASVMLEHKMLNQYELATAHKQTIAAMFTVFITSLNNEAMGLSTTPTPSDGHGFSRNGERLTPGTMQYLLPGEDIKFAQPPTVSEFDPYVRSKLRKIAAGWGLSYEVLSNDWSMANFASGRMGWVEMHKNIKNIQSLILIPKLCNRVYEWYLELEILKGTFPINVADLVSCTWTPPRRELLDPVKEVKAIIEQIQAGLKPFSEAIREFGGDPENWMDMIAADYKMIDDRKLTLLSDYRVIVKEATKGNPPKEGV